MVGALKYCWAVPTILRHGTYREKIAVLGITAMTDV